MRPLPAIVRRGLRSTVESHPDVDLLAAFSERTLANPERALVLGHLSRCAECREVVSLAIPLLTSIEMDVRPARSWRPVLVWSGLAACAAVAAGLFWLPRGSQEIRQAKNEPPPAVLQKTVTEAASYLPVAPSPAPPALKDKTTDVQGRNGGKENIEGNKAEANKSENEKDLTAPATFAKLQAPRAAGELRDGARAQPVAVDAFEKKTAEAAVPQMQESFANAPASDAGIANKIRLDDRYPHWTLDSDGTLLRSLNGSAPWQKVEVPGKTAVLRAIATIGPDVWVGGSGGVVYHSADTGSHWEQVTPASGGKTLADDVIGISFTSPLEGKLITRQQQTWTTHDGGKTWTAQ